MDDIFRYAEPLAPLPTTASKIKPPSRGSAKPGPAMKPIMPRLGKAANLPSPIPPDTKVMTPSPHPEVPTAPKVPHALRAGNPDTLRQRIPRPPKPRYKLQVPLHDAYNTAYRELTEDMATLTHPEDIEDRKQEIGDLQDAFESGNDRLMVRFLEDHVGWKTFNSLVQSLHDKEPAVTSRKGLFARADEDMFAYAEDDEEVIRHGNEDLRQHAISKGRSHFYAMRRDDSGRFVFDKHPIDMFAYAETEPRHLRLDTRPQNPKLSMNAPPTNIPNVSQLEAEKPTVVPAPAKPGIRKMGLHPIPEPKIDPWWHEMPHTNWLRNAEETHRQRLPGGINGGWMIKLAGEHPQHDYKAIWKAADDDRTAEARPQTIPEGNPHGHEAAAWEIAHLVGMGGMVPPTVARENRGQIGSAQHFVPGQERAFESNVPFGKPGNPQLPLAAAFDALTMNTDRHMKNWLVDPENGQLTLIDHGLLFPHTHAKRLIGNGEILGNAMQTGIPVPQEVVKWEGQWPHIERAMKRNGLTDEQIALTQSRLASLADAARNGESFKHWLKRSGIGNNYELH